MAFPGVLAASPVAGGLENLLFSSHLMKTLIPNHWEHISERVAVAQILKHDVDPEGLDFTRVRFASGSDYELPRDEGTLLSVLGGVLELATVEYKALRLEAGTHVYLPPNSKPRLRGLAGTEMLHACARHRQTALGERSSWCEAIDLSRAVPLQGRSLRWILTPQYLSRRAFLHHDQTLISPRGEPLSWFHTTMFDAHGLPENDEGSPVFKMSYNYRTEPNVCYDVQGTAQVRVAVHPYSPTAAMGALATSFQ